MRELRAARAIAHRANARCSSLQSFVDFDVPPRVQYDSCCLEADPLGVWRASSSDQQIGSLNLLSPVAVFSNDSRLLTRESAHFMHSRVEQHFDSFAREILQKRLRNVRIFGGGDLRATFDYRYRSSEAAQGLREFETDVSSTEYDQVFRQTVEIQRLHVSHRPHSSKTGDIRDRRSRS